MGSAISDVYLTAPDLSPTNIMGYNVGVRPCRKAGIRLETQSQGNQLIIHNYGYGGSGLTLCWGGAQSVIALLQQAQASQSQLAKITNVAIIGAGVIGLSIAYELLKLGYRVAVYAAGFPPHLTSNVAAGILSPTMVYFDPTAAQKQMLDKLLDISIKRYLESFQKEKPEFAGIQLYRDYTVEVRSKTHSQYHKYSVIPTKQKQVKIHFDNGVTKLGIEKQELGLDGKLFMADLYQQTLNKGAIFYRHYFNNAKEISALAEPIVINCTSMGSRLLFDDHSFLPIRGHLIYLKPQPGVDYAFYQNVPEAPNYWVKLYPWQDRAVLGGVFENNVEDNKVDERVIERLHNYAQACFKLHSEVLT